ncbi:conserved hypothetical protein [Talaromyces stipitatus ATCC 10500]|uniref:2,6-dihydroxypyridine 3-monooxygenase substrate binding domain-containing protein n=1 Tax=Talaromyces stipitatus (strain ATCC 10500 / CBS 375.48 / QM 6759 / NRRL 1006) TaxID=441959 RepID=B8MSF9_TALSN|nr:uncharacterized protein TSTA_000320 [Talaromyces stipitatus ATCC 10500]EED11954.1 conserved hypothetical protein [Talaromyces stipitatus ATCC 10500]
MEWARKPLEIVIIGGSLTGLLCGVALKHAGHTVTIIEKDDNERQSHMAGVCLGLDAAVFLTHHDRHETVFCHSCTSIQAVTRDNGIKPFLKARREITNWDTFYFRLRSLFDGYSNSYYPALPKSINTDGCVAYKCRSEVSDISRATNGEGKMVLTILNHEIQQLSTKEADFVIGADGPNSVIRAKYAPSVHRQYAGYIAWRGLVPESEVSASTRKIFDHSVTVHMMDRHHCLMYIIPGQNGSLKPGNRFLNFLWYTNESTEALDEIMVDDLNGHRHQYIVPAGHVRKDIWDARLDRAKNLPLAAPFLEVILKIQQPFIQVITDFCSPRATFEDGQVLLAGDALSLCRPHTAFSCTQAAFHASLINNYINQQMSLTELEERMVRYSFLHWRQSIWWGEFYQRNKAVALLSGLCFWGYCGIDIIKSWWRGEERLFRGSSYIIKKHD